MNQRDHKIVAEYTRKLADMMELCDWTIELSKDPAPNDAYGHMLETYGRKLAVISVCKDFRELNAGIQRHTIIHELVHCHFASHTSMVLNDLEDTLGKTTDQVFWNGFKRQVEYAVDALASALEKHLPLIDWKVKP